MLKNYFLLILKNFSRRKLRGWLTIIGILIGVAAVVALIAVAQGMQSSIQQQFEKMGTNKLIIMPGSGDMGMGGAFAGQELTKDDLEVVEKVSGVDLAAEMFYRSGKVKFSDETKNTFIIGLSPGESWKIISGMQGFDTEKGRNLREEDRYVVMVGWKLWNDDFFEKKISLRDKIEIEGQEFKVIGLMKKIGNPADDSQIYIPIEIAREIYNEPDEISSMFVQVKEGYDIKDVAEKIKKDLRDKRNEEKGEETFSVQTFEQLLSTFTSILGVMGSVLIVIALISLLVGGIGIMNTMYTSVLERTREIGIMKAVGAKNNQILILFMMESGFYGITGGLLGVLLGAGLAKAAEFGAAAAGYGILKIAMPAWLILGSLLFSFVIGCVSGVAPARAAAKMKPVEALRYE